MTSQFRTASEHELIPGAAAGYTFTTLSLNPAAYLNWLLARFLSSGGSTKRVNLQHISQVRLAEQVFYGLAHSDTDTMHL